MKNTRRSEAEPSKRVREVRSSWRPILSAAIALAIGYWSYAAYVPSTPVVQILTSGTTYTVPAGATSLEVTLLGGAGGGGAATSGGSLALSGGGGGGGTYNDLLITGSLPGSYTYALGAGGTAGTCSGAPTAGGAGGNTTWTMNYPAWAASTVENVGEVILDSNSHVQVVVAITSDDKTGSSAPTWATTVGAQTTDNHVTWSEYAAAAPTLQANGANPGGTASTTVAGTAGTGAAGPAGTQNYGPNVNVLGDSGEANGLTGNTTSVPANGQTLHTTGGSSASVLVTTGACSAVATPGQAGYIIVKVYFQ